MWHITQDMTLEIVIDIGIDIDIDIDIGIDIGHWHWTLTLTLDIEIDIGFLVPHSLSVLRGYYSETWYCQSSTKSHSEGSIEWPTWLIVARCCFIAKWSNISTPWAAPGMSFYRHVLETQQVAIHCFVGHSPGVGYPNSCFIQTNNWNCFYNVSSSFCQYIGWGVMRLPLSLIVARLRIGWLLMRFPGPPKSLFLCFFILIFFYDI